MYVYGEGGRFRGNPRNHLDASLIGSSHTVAMARTHPLFEDIFAGRYATSLVSFVFCEIKQIGPNKSYKTRVGEEWGHSFSLRSTPLAFCVWATMYVYGEGGRFRGNPRNHLDASLIGSSHTVAMARTHPLFEDIFAGRYATSLVSFVFCEIKQIGPNKSYKTRVGEEWGHSFSLRSTPLAFCVWATMYVYGEGGRFRGNPRNHLDASLIGSSHTVAMARTHPLFEDIFAGRYATSLVSFVFCEIKQIGLRECLT